MRYVLFHLFKLSLMKYIIKGDNLAFQVLKNHSNLQNEHQQMLVDQLTLQKLHEQLTSEYDTLAKEKEGLKVNFRDLRAEQRLLKEKYDILASTIESLRAERDTLKEESRSLNNLRAEHSKLKVVSHCPYNSFTLNFCVVKLSSAELLVTFL